jgi:hypothetical protein
MPDLLEPHDARECDAVTNQMCDAAIQCLAEDDLKGAEDWVEAIRYRVATIQAEARRFWNGGR